ncbi:uncharacterized protein LOC134691358 [Mytilus trossulus]|uniref:uncharacterized protein LOC134691358 n=1 Tax=Mytilus trossulus TaxID=6551 RepID=UPI00300593E3
MACDLVIQLKMAKPGSLVLLFLSFLLFLVPQIFCHLCLISPTQRGSMTGLNTEASKDCILLKPPCGGRPSEPKNAAILRAGQNTTVTFQKNLNHWIQKSPGEFRVNLGVEGTEKFQSLAVVKDNNEPNLHLYTVPITVPSDRLKQTLVLQVVYVTNNPQAPPMFYQCRDVQIIDNF